MTAFYRIGLAACWMIAASLWAGPAMAQDCPIPANAAVLETAVGQGVNQFRAAASLRGLSADPRLNAAAQTHACDMVRNNYLNHRGSDRSGPHDRVIRTGYQSCLTAENIAWGYPAPDDIVRGWSASPGHRSNMQIAQARHYGVGVAQGARGPVWVMVLARPC
jgi:uncharacterized protein YkwD